MINAINILGAWNIGISFATKASVTFPELTVNLFTRNAEKLIEEIKFNTEHTLKRENISIQWYNSIPIICLPTFYCISTDEKTLIQGLRDSKQEITRLSVMQSNIRIANDLQIFIKKLQPKDLYIMSNPTELVAQFLKTRIPELNIYWLWLNLDWYRIRVLIETILQEGLNEEIIVLWNHFIPVPIISESNFIKNLLCQTPNDIIQSFENFNYPYQKTALDFTEEIKKFIEKTIANPCDKIDESWLYDFISFSTSLLIRSEFSGPQPPIDHPVDSMVGILENLMKEEPTNLLTYNGYIYKWWTQQPWNNKIKEISISDREQWLIQKSIETLYWKAFSILIE